LNPWDGAPINPFFFIDVVSIGLLLSDAVSSACGGNWLIEVTGKFAWCAVLVVAFYSIIELWINIEAKRSLKRERASFKNLPS